MVRRMSLRLAIVTLLAPPLSAQNPTPDPPRDPSRDINVFAITDAREKNRAALSQYTWKLELQVALDGDMLSEELFQARYDAEGMLRTELLAARQTPAGKRRGRKGALDQEHGQRLHRLLMAYVEMPPERLSEALTNAVSTEDADGGSTTRVQARGAIHEGDSYDLWIDSATRRPRRFEVFTSLQGEPVRLVARFEGLDGGPVYPSEATVNTEVGEKKMVISIRNFDFERH